MKTTCNVAQDLIPLVQDGVASDDSRKLVEEHAKTCEACRRLLNGSTAAPPMAEDDRFVKKLRQSFYLLRFLVLLALALYFSTFLNSSLIFACAAAMPALGALAAGLLHKKGLWVFPMILASSLLAGALKEGSIVGGLQITLIYGPAFALLALAGFGAYSLLYYAFKGKCK